LHTLLLPTLLLIGLSLCEVLELFVSFPTSPSSLKTEFVCIFYCVFGFGGFTGYFLRKVLTSPYLVFYLLLILEFYGLHWVGLSLRFSKSPSLLTLESGCKSYHRFRLLSFSVGANPVSTGNFTGEAGFGPASPGCTPAGPTLVSGLHQDPSRTVFRRRLGAHLAMLGRSGAEPGETEF
jgi:hypothetical protein